MSRPARLTILLIALAFGCSAQSVDPRHTTAQAQAAPAAVASTNVCAGVAGCRQVTKIDVDGDGRADQVGVVSHKLDGGGSITVRVRTATNATLQTTGRHVRWFAKPWLGAAPLDGVKGAELFVGSTMGANYEQFRVITYRAGKLVTLKAPAAAPGSGGKTKLSSRWEIDGAYSFNIGVSRAVSSQGVKVTMTSLERNLSGRGHTGHRSVYRWASGGWQQVSTHKVKIASDKAAFAVGGWHVSGLRRFA
jgi:hypothetical protein